MNKKAMGIKAKLLLLTLVAVISFAGLATYSIKSIIELRTQVELLGLKRIPISESLGSIRAGSNAVPRFLWLSLAQSAGSPERAKSIAKVTEYWDIWKKGLADIKTNLESDKAKVKLAEIEELMPKLQAVVEDAKNSLALGTKDADVHAKDTLIKDMPPLAVKLTALIKDLSEIVNETNTSIVTKAQDQVLRIQTVLITLSIAIGAALILFGVTFSTKLSNHLLAITNSVAEASAQVSAASTQLSNAAEQLSSASQEQAAATEQTSASLTEISGMVEANVQGAEQGNEYAQEVYSISEDTKRSMEELQAAMKQILESNSKIEELAKVIEEIGEKTQVIDDIVFKTQLLSFNASVEAERAGEHGRGFAVVAQEVGNLAQMSGKAATEIATIVKHSIKEASSIAGENKGRVEHGGSLAASTGNKMTQVLKCLSNILENTNKILAASKEQSQGINQITSSVDGLNQSTQEIASTSQESASASEELSGQADALLSLVGDLRMIITGDAKEEVKHADKRSVASHGHKVNVQMNTRPKAKNAGANVLAKRIASNESAGANDEWEKL